MTLLTRASDASIDTSTAQFAPQIPDLLAGEDLDIAAPCYIKSSDGKAYMTNATAANEAAEVVGFTARAVKSGQPVTLFGSGTRFRYAASGLTPGDLYYAGATAGRLDTAATTGDAMGVAMAVTATDIVVVRHSPVPLTATGSASLNGTQVATVANANVIGGIPVVHRIDIAAGALGDTDVVLTHKTRVIDAWLVLRGAGVATTTLQVKNGANAITDAMAASGSDQAVVRAASLNDANWEIAAGGTLRVTSATGATQPDATVYVLGLRVA
jgi:hypothetical protein